MLAFLPDPAKLDLDAIAELTQLAVAPRYPGWVDPIDRPVAERARATALAVKQVVLASLAAGGFVP